MKFSGKNENEVKEDNYQYNKELVGNLAIIYGAVAIITTAFLLISGTRSFVIIATIVSCAAVSIVAAIMRITTTCCKTVLQYAGVILVVTATITLTETWQFDNNFLNFPGIFALLFSTFFSVTLCWRGTFTLELWIFWGCFLYTYLRCFLQSHFSTEEIINISCVLLICGVNYSVFVIYKARAFLKYMEKFILLMHGKRLWLNCFEESQDCLLIFNNKILEYANRAARLLLHIENINFFPMNISELIENSESYSLG